MSECWVNNEVEKLRNCARVCLEGSMKKKCNLRTVDALAEIRNENLPNKSQESYRFRQFLCLLASNAENSAAESHSLVYVFPALNDGAEGRLCPSDLS
jgi:hypothetical protein